jgi:hypothetical protein
MKEAKPHSRKDFLYSAKKQGILFIVLIIRHLTKQNAVNECLKNKAAGYN